MVALSLCFCFFSSIFFPHTEYAVTAFFRTVHFVSGQWLCSLAEDLGPELAEDKALGQVEAHFGECILSPTKDE